MSALLIVVASVALALPFGPPRVGEATSRRALAEQRAGAPLPADSLEARRRAADVIQRFLQSWRKAWLASERERLRAELSLSNPDHVKAERAHRERALHVQCTGYGYATNPAPVMSANGGFGKCPSFVTADSRPPHDEADHHDARLVDPHRANIQSDRADLIVTLDSLQRHAPGDGLIVGQRVRFMVDEGRVDEAIRTARRCLADAIWCAALQGYALASRGRAAEADSAFELVTRLTPPASRCEWTDIATILTRQEREGYRAQSCAVRDSLARRYWWLARPLLREVPGPHLRRVEHYRRKVLVLLHASLPFDELHDLRPSHGGDAVTELLLRYGWPTVTAWTGDSVDKHYDSFLTDRRAPTVRPYSIAEYSPGRARFGAALSTVRDPFHADTAAWDLRPPAHKVDAGYAGPSSPRTWWPFEHMRFRAGTVMQLPSGQTGFFRRPRSLRVLTAVETGDVLRGGDDEAPRAALVASRAPDSVVIIADSPVSSAGRVELAGEIAARPMLLAVESTGTPSRPLVARTRFGTMPPPPLDSLPPGAIAISAPVFFAAASAQGLPRDLDALSRVMLGGTAVPQGGNVGLFWETYGAAASDSVRYTVQVSRMESVGMLQRLGALLQVLKLPMASVAVTWQEVERRASDVAGSLASNAASPAVAIAAGSIELDLASLSRGTYMIEVTAAVAGRPEARAGRVLTIR